MHLAALCDMWMWKWHQWILFGCFQRECSLCPPLCGSEPPPPFTLIRVLVVLGTPVKLVKQQEIQLAIHSTVDVLTDYI